MSKVLPFQAYYYNHDHVERYANVITPPYDVISPDMQKQFYDLSPYNFCRVDLPQEEGEARYEKAKQVFQDWLEQGVLLQDSKPALYLHAHTFVLPDGRKKTRQGFFAARKIETFEEGGIKPHEKTLEGPKSDRLKITRATQANLSPVFSLYSDPELQIGKWVSRTMETTPFIDFTFDDGDRHQLWKLTDESIIQEINTFLSDRPLFIADGHHRYETALNYRNEVMQNHADLADNAAPKQLLMYFSNMDDDGMVILPIHRALHSLKDFNADELLKTLSTDFELQDVTDLNEDQRLSVLAENADAQHRFLLLFKGGKASVASIGREAWLSHESAQNIPEQLRGLDVVVLHRHIFENLLGISEESQAKQENLIYWKSTQKALDEVENGKCQVTVLLNSTRIEDMKQVALAGEKMPQKSTYFYPKIMSGLVLHSVRETDVDGLSS